MIRVTGIDHLAIRVSDYKKSKAFYARLFKFLGFKISDEYQDAIGWTNGKTRFWISPADAKGRAHKHRAGNIGFHHYAFQLRSRKDVDARGLPERGPKEPGSEACRVRFHRAQAPDSITASPSDFQGNPE